MKNDGSDNHRYLANNLKNPHAIRREVSFRQQCNSSADKRLPANVIGSSCQIPGKQTPPSISNVTSVERARARALQAVNYYNSSVLGDPSMEPVAQFSGMHSKQTTNIFVYIFQSCQIFYKSIWQTFLLFSLIIS